MLQFYTILKRWYIENGGNKSWVTYWFIHQQSHTCHVEYLRTEAVHFHFHIENRNYGEWIFWLYKFFYVSKFPRQLQNGPLQPAIKASFVVLLSLLALWTMVNIGLCHTAEVKIFIDVLASQANVTHDNMQAIFINPLDAISLMANYENWLSNIEHFILDISQYRSGSGECLSYNIHVAQCRVCHQ